MQFEGGRLKNGMKNVVKKPLLILFSTFIGLTGCEIGLRLLGNKFSGSTYIADPLLGWSLRPGAGAWEADEGVAWSKINSHGFRDRDRALIKPRGVYRVAVLGDSYTEARQVDMNKTFTALSEVELKRRHCFGESNVEVLNFGVPGYGTGQELLLLRERVWKFSPDMIVLQVFTGNDIFNNHRALNVSTPDLAPYFLLKDGNLTLDDRFRKTPAFNPTRIKLKGIAADVMNNSVLLQLVYKLRRLRAQQEELAHMDATEVSAASNAPPPEYQRYLAFLPPTVPSMVEAWQVTDALIAEFGREASSHHAPLLIMLIPTAHQTYADPKDEESYRAHYKIESLEYADDRVERQSLANGIPVLRLTEPLKEVIRRTGKYPAGFANTAPNEGHLNELGHAVVARELVQAICALATAQPIRKGT